jgi:hypothetical protein
MIRYGDGIQFRPRHKIESFDRIEFRHYRKMDINMHNKYNDIPINAVDILDNISDGVIVIDENYKIVYANKRFIDDSGISSSK